MALLEVTDLCVAFGGSLAVDHVSLEVGEGKLVGLIGPNGAGKTTTVDAVTGFVPSVGGVRFKNHALQLPGTRQRSMPPARRAHLGLARTWQGADLFVDLSVLDNLRVAGEHLPDTEHRQLLETLGIGELANGSVLALSHGQRKLVGVARALAARPALVCMDEPAAGLDTSESRFLGERIRAIADGGTSVLLIDHDMGLVLGICDFVYVLDFGRIIATGPPSQIRADQRVLDAYLGTRHGAAAPAGAEGTEAGSAT